MASKYITLDRLHHDARCRRFIFRHLYGRIGKQTSFVVFFLCLFLGLIMVKNSGLSNIVRLDAIAVRQRAATPMTQSKRL